MLDVPPTNHRQTTGYQGLDKERNKFFMFIGSVVENQVDANDRFLYFFMTLTAFIFCWQHCQE